MSRTCNENLSTIGIISWISTSSLLLQVSQMTSKLRTVHFVPCLPCSYSWLVLFLASHSLHMDSIAGNVMFRHKYGMV